jgi:hypothetical protein
MEYPHSKAMEYPHSKAMRASEKVAKYRKILPAIILRY